MKYKVGDKVRVRSDLVVDAVYGEFTFVGAMVEYMGKEFAIQDAQATVGNTSTGYRLDNACFSWSDEMLEPASEKCCDVCDVKYCNIVGHNLVGTSTFHCADYKPMKEEDVKKDYWIWAYKSTCGTWTRTEYYYDDDYKDSVGDRYDALSTLESIKLEHTKITV